MQGRLSRYSFLVLALLSGAAQAQEPVVAESLTLAVGRGYHTATFSPDGQRLASVGASGKNVLVWDAFSGKVVLELPATKDEAFDVAFSPDGKWLASAQRTGARLWQVSSGGEVFTTSGQTRVTRVAFSPDSKLLATAGTGGIRIWGVPGGKELCAMAGDKVWESTVAFSPDGKQVASGNQSKTVKLWDAVTGRELATFKGHLGPVYTLAYSPDGTRIASASGDGTLKLWDVKSGAELHTLRGHKLKVNSVAFSPDGGVLLSGGSDKTLKLWDVRSGRELLTLAGPAGEVFSVRFSPEGLRLASTGNDGLVRFWALGISGGGVLTRAQLEEAWRDLLGRDLLKATRALLVLSRAKEESLPFLHEKLRPAEAAPVDMGKLGTLVRQLGHATFSSREEAMSSLGGLGKTAEPALRLALAGPLDLEQRRRVQRLLARCADHPPSPEQLHAERVAKVLERIGSAGAQGLLARLAAGAPGTWLTEEARASLERMGTR